MKVESSVFVEGMPAWLAGYLAIYIAFALWSFKDDIARQVFTIQIGLELVGSSCLIAAVVAYWNPTARSFFGDWIVWIFAIGIFSFVVFAVSRVQATLIDPVLTVKQRIASSMLGVGVLVVGNLPLIWFGSRLALKSG